MRSVTVSIEPFLPDGVILPTVTFNRPPAGVDVDEMQRTWDALTSPWCVTACVDAVPVGDAWRD